MNGRPSGSSLCSNSTLVVHAHSCFMHLISSDIGKQAESHPAPMKSICFYPFLRFRAVCMLLLPSFILTTTLWGWLACSSRPSSEIYGKVRIWTWGSEICSDFYTKLCLGLYHCRAQVVAYKTQCFVILKRKEREFLHTENHIREKKIILSI